MSAEYSVGELRTEASKQLEYGSKTAWEMLTAYADLRERIEADERAVPADSGRIRDALIAAQKLLRQNHDAIRGALDNHERKEATLVMDQIRDALSAQGQGDRWCPACVVCGDDMVPNYPSAASPAPSATKE